MKKKILCILSLFLILFNLFISVPVTIFAKESYSSVVDDLSKDESFTEKDYPIDTDNYSIDIIEIAESKDNELIIYIYNPSMILDVDRIFLSYTNDESVTKDYIVYDLEEVSSHNALEKHIVKDFNFSKDDKTRIYSVSMLQRKFNNFYDTSGINTINYVAIDVNTSWIFEEDDYGNIYVDKSGIKTIKITNKYGGRIRYLEGWYLAKQSTDSHYIAFSTDYKIEDLLEAKVSFDYTNVVRTGYLFCHKIPEMTFTWSWGYEIYQQEPKSTLERVYVEENKTEEQFKNNHIELSKEEVFKVGEGLFCENYEYARIQTVSDFLAYEQKEKLTEFDNDLIKNIRNKQWVLRYYESNYLYNEYWNFLKGSESMRWEEMYTHISNLAILELTFEVKGVKYILPTIDNAIETEDTPDNKNWFDEGLDILPDNLDDQSNPNLITLILVILFLVLIISLIGVLLPVLTTCINFLLLPFKSINKAFKKLK